MRRTVVSVLVVGVFMATGPAVQAQSNAQCLICHARAGLQDQAGHSVYVNEAREKASVHGRLPCTACHTSIAGFPHPARVTPVDCATCHRGEATGVAASVHAKAKTEPCLSCHRDPHAIVPVTDPKSPVFPLNVPRTCGACHGSAGAAKKLGLHDVYALYIDSIHGFAVTRDGLLVAATCSSCHGAHRILSHSDPASPTYRTNIPATCGRCHAGPEAQYLAGVHGRALRDGETAAPECVDCHTVHQIAEVQSASWQMKVPATCGHCHQPQLSTYRDTFHAQVSALGYVDVARCWNCHRAHDILPPSDPHSSVAPANLVATCSQCHRGATASFVSYQPHADPHNRRAYPALYFATVFMNLLLIGVLGLFGLHTILWLIRSMAERRAHGTSEGGNAR